MKARSAIVRRTVESDIRAIEPLEVGSENLSHVYEAFHARAALYTVMAPDQSHPLAILGANEIFPGNLELWSFVDRRATSFPMAYARSAKLVLDTLALENNPRRLQVLISTRFPWAVKWATMLGLFLESRLYKYGPEGEDYFIFAKVRK